jgi:hypothetical protein
MIQAFTGPSKLTVPQALFAEQTIRSLPEATRRSGGAYGLDTIVARVTSPDDLVLVGPQGEWFNRDLLSTAKFVRWVDGGYRKRNEALVQGADVLHAFLKEPTFYRSGEWMTVNIAKRAGVPVVVHLLP